MCVFVIYTLLCPFTFSLKIRLLTKPPCGEMMRYECICDAVSYKLAHWHSKSQGRHHLTSFDYHVPAGWAGKKSAPGSASHHSADFIYDFRRGRCPLFHKNNKYSTFCHLLIVNTLLIFFFFLKERACLALSLFTDGI